MCCFLRHPGFNRLVSLLWRAGHNLNTNEPQSHLADPKHRSDQESHTRSLLFQGEDTEDSPPSPTLEVAFYPVSRDTPRKMNCAGTPRREERDSLPNSRHCQVPRLAAWFRHQCPDGMRDAWLCSQHGYHSSSSYKNWYPLPVPSSSSSLPPLSTQSPHSAYSFTPGGTFLYLPPRGKSPTWSHPI